VITEITLRLRPARAGVPRTVVGAFDTVLAAGEAVAATTRGGLVPAALEMLDRFTLRAVEDWKHLGLDADAEVLLLAQVDTPGRAGDDEAAALAEVFRGAGALWAEQSTDEVEAEALFAARRLAYPRWNGSGRCSPRTSAYRAPRCRRCSPRSRTSPSGTAPASPPSRTPVTATCTR
jgi:glycolate oxidase